MKYYDQNITNFGRLVELFFQLTKKKLNLICGNTDKNVNAQSGNIFYCWNNI